MSDHEIGPLHVYSDLRLLVGGLRAEIVSDGSRITVSTDDPARLFEQATSGPLPFGAPDLTVRAAIARAGRLLGEAGLSASVHGRRGAVLEVGHDCASRSGRLLLGADNVRLGPIRAVAPVAAGYVVAAVRRRVSYFVAGLAVAALLGGVTAGRRAGR